MMGKNQSKEEPKVSGGENSNQTKGADEGREEGIGCNTIIIIVIVILSRFSLYLLLPSSSSSSSFSDLLNAQPTKLIKPQKN